VITGRMFGDPGPCPVDDTPHTACIGPSPEIAVVQLPARDGNKQPKSAASYPPGAAAGRITTSNYRRGSIAPR
jgi:hypothetical protein